MRILVGVISLGFWLVGCTTTQNLSIGEIKTTYDEFKKKSVETVQVGDNAFLTRISTENTEVIYAMIVDVFTSGNKAARPDEAVFLIDGEALTLVGSSDLVDLAAGVYSMVYYERAYFITNPIQIKKIYSGDKVTVRMYGDSWSSVANMVDSPRKQAFKRFYDLFVQRRWDHMTDTERIESGIIIPIEE
jgi:hypothetical protein